MKKGRNTFYAFVLTALVSAVAIPLTASAQQQEEAPVEQAATTEDFDRLITAIGTINDQVAALEALTGLEAAHVQIVDVQDVLAGSEENAMMFEETVAENTTNISALQEEVTEQAVITTLLESEQVPLEDVLAVYVAGEDEVFLFHR